MTPCEKGGVFDVGFFAAFSSPVTHIRSNFYKDVFRKHSFFSSECLPLGQGKEIALEKCLQYLPYFHSYSP